MSAVRRLLPSGKPADADETASFGLTQTAWWSIALKLPARDELLRIIAAAGVTLLVVAFAVLFFRWVFSSSDREHRRLQPLAVLSSAESSGSISASRRLILRTSSPISVSSAMMPDMFTNSPRRDRTSAPSPTVHHRPASADLR